MDFLPPRSQRQLTRLIVSSDFQFQYLIEPLEQRTLLTATSTPQLVSVASGSPARKPDIEFAPLDASTEAPTVTISGDENGGGKLHHADGDQWFWRSPNQVLYFHISIVDGPMLDAWNKSDTVDGEWHERAFAPEDLEIGHWWDDSLGHTWSSFDMHWGNPDEPYWKNDTATVHINLQPANSDSPFDGWDGQLEEDPGITDLNGNGIPDRMEPDPNNPNPPPPDPTDITDPNNPIGNYDPSDDPIESQTGDGGGEIGDQVSLEGHNGSVDIHGVPIPEPSPTGEGESDRLPNMAKIDAFSLSPSFSTTDVGVPMPGDELLMEFRRTLSTGLDVYHPFSTAPNIDKHFAGETILGSAWRTNIGSHVTISFNPSPAPGEPGYRATVYDEIGNPISYYSNDDAVYKSDVRSSFTNMALRAKLERNVTYEDQNYDFVYTEEHGTRLFFKYAEMIDRENQGQQGGPNDKYYRLERIIDRNNNEIRYDYETSDPTLVTTIYDPSLGDAGTSERRISFAYTNLNYATDPAWRLSSVTDPLGREYDYQYDSAWRLIHVLKPDPEVGRPGTPVRPTISFTYDVQAQLKAYIKSNSQGIFYNGEEFEAFTLPATITDALNNVTSFHYTNYWTPTGIRSEGTLPVFLYQNRPLISSVTTSDGTAYFHPVSRTEFQEVTQVTDTRGDTTTYTFGSGSTAQLVHAPNSLGWAIALDQVKREINVADADGATSTKTATFRYSLDIDGDLTEVDDMSGNVLRYSYDSGDSGDPYNARPFDDATHQYGTLYEIFGQPAQRIMAADELNLTTSYRYDVNFNKLIREVDPEGNITTYSLDDNGNRIAVTAADGSPVASTTSYTFDDPQHPGFMTSQTDPDGRVTEYEPNGYGNLMTTTVEGISGENFTPIITSRDADVMDRTLSSMDGNGNTTRYTYDNWDRATQTTLPAVENPLQNAGGDPLSDPTIVPITKKVYDFNSNVLQETDANGNVTVHTYDAMNRQLSSELRLFDPTGNFHGKDLIKSWTYTPVGLVATETDPMGRVTTHEYDALLREIRTTQPTVTVDSDPASTASSPSTTTRQYVTKMYYGDNSGSGAFTLGGFNPTRVVNARGYATDTVYDSAYRAIATIRRHDDGTGIDSTAAARSGEPETDTVYNKDGKPIEVTVKNETRGGVSDDRTTYTFYDHQMRPTVVAVDMNGDGVGSDPATTPVDDPSLFSAQNDDLVTRTSYDGASHPTVTEDAEGRVTQTVYDGAGRAIEVDLPTVDLYLPDGGGLLQDQSPQTTTVYDANSNPILTTDANGNQTQTEYDALNRPVRTILDRNRDSAFDPTQGPSANDVVTVTGYDLNGNKVYTIDPNGNRTDSTYDRANRVTLVKAPQVADAEHGGTLSRPQTSTSYDKNGNVLTVTDPRGIVTTTQYDELNRPRFVTAHSNSLIGAPDRLVTETRYDENGNKLAVVLYNLVGSAVHPQVTIYVYDAFDRQTSEKLPAIDGATRQTTTAYNRAGQPITVTDPKGQVVQTEYDRAGRESVTQFYRANSSLEELRSSMYDKVGNLTIRADLNGRSSYTYDPLNRQTSETRDTSYTIYNYYDGDGNRTKVVYPGTNRTLISHYDGANRMVQLDDGSKITTFGYDAAGNRTSETQANGVVETSTFDALNRVESIHAQKGSDPAIYDLSYGYDLAGQRRTATEKLTGQPERDLSWGYDGLYRLVSEAWTGPKAQTDSYTYDPAGNRLTKNVNYVDPGTLDTYGTYTYNDLNQLLTMFVNGSTAVSTSYEYDFNGNRTEKQDSTGVFEEYDYDTSDRLIDVRDVEANDTTIFSATYDARSRRLSTTEGGKTTVFRYDGGTNFQELQDTNNDGTPEIQTELIRAGGLGGGIGSILYTDKAMAPTAGPTEFFVYDALGNTTAVTDSNGNATQATLYDAFGETVVQSHAPASTPTGFPSSVHLTVTYPAADVGGDPSSWPDVHLDWVKDSTDPNGGYYEDSDHTFSIRWTGDTVTVTDVALSRSFTVAQEWDGSVRTFVLNEEYSPDGEWDFNTSNGGGFSDNSERPAAGWMPAGYPTSIHVNVTQSAETDGAFTLPWDETLQAYTGAGGVNGLTIEVAHETDTSWRFTAPDEGLDTPFTWDGSTDSLELNEDTNVASASNGGGLTNNSQRPAAGWGASTNNRLHNTKERDASIGLDNFGFRYYDPETAIFIQRDPSGYSDGLNVYMSVHDNPINGVDPQGLATLETPAAPVGAQSTLGCHAQITSYIAPPVSGRTDHRLTVGEVNAAFATISPGFADPQRRAFGAHQEALGFATTAVWDGPRPQELIPAEEQDSIDAANTIQDTIGWVPSLALQIPNAFIASMRGRPGAAAGYLANGLLGEAGAFEEEFFSGASTEAAFSFEGRTQAASLGEEAFIGSESSSIPAEGISAEVQQPSVKATFSVGGQSFFDVNALARTSRVAGPTIPGLRAPNADQLTMHAEIGTMFQADQAGIRGGDGVLTLQGENVCQNYCRGDVKTYARHLDLNSLTVQDADSNVYYFADSDSLQTVRRGGQGWK